MTAAETGTAPAASPGAVSIPACAWSRRLDAEVPLMGSPVRLTLSLVLHMFPTLMRAVANILRETIGGRKPVVAGLGLVARPVMGVPLGGLGGGTVTRGWRGDFVRWQLRPGLYDYRTVPVDQFALWAGRGPGDRRAVVLGPEPEPPAGRRWPGLAGWNWGLDPSRATYHALYPRAWTVYQEPLPGLCLTCRQVSPVIPHDYAESSYPAGVFVWTVENAGAEDADIALMFSFQNGTGARDDLAGGHANQAWNSDGNSDLPRVSGVSLRHVQRRRGQPADPLTFAIAAAAGEGIEVTTRTRVVTQGAAAGLASLWRDFAQDGRLDQNGSATPSLAGEVAETSRPSARGEAIGAAVAARVRVPAGGRRDLVFALAWDMPIARFGSGTGWYRRYTRFYGREGNAAATIARDTISAYASWEERIDAWQRPILSDPDLPDWYKSLLFNETYYLADGGTVWTAGRVDASEEPGVEGDGFLPEDDLGHFGYLESHEYLMYNTYDVHFSASFALAALWPELELSLQRDFARSIAVEHPEPVTYLLSGQRGPRKVRGVIPHDLGAPTEDPWRRLNAYNAQDVSRWKDLGAKFVLQVYRDYVLTGNKEFLADVWAGVEASIANLLQFDRDGDGLIENEGYPDQTYDVWSAEGPSAYTGGLWLACLAAAAASAAVLGHGDRETFYRSLLTRAQAAYETRLWNGSYYNYDSSRSRHHDSVMADQLAGQWFALACGLPPVVPRERARSALGRIHDLNVLGWTGRGRAVGGGYAPTRPGERGAVNGMRPDGNVDRTCMQSAEVWTGTTFTLAAAMLQEGMKEEALAAAKGIYLTLYRDFPLWFQAPEGVDVDGVYRAIGYMRPLSVWSIQWEWERLKVVGQRTRGRRRPSSHETV